MRIVGVNDIYTLENMPRLKSLIEHYSKTDPADVFIVTLAGDFVSPSILSSLDAGHGMIECMNMAGITHVCLGNHEDDISSEELLKRVDEFHGTWIDTNVRIRADLPKSVVFRVSSNETRTVNVGTIGVVTVDPALYRPPFTSQQSAPASEAAMAETARLVWEEGLAVC
ncbi:MAG: metallophosphoesterase [Polyangiaceae bacterium]